MLLSFLATARQGASQVVPVVKNLPAKARDPRDMGLIPGLGRSPEGEHGSPLQISWLENPMNRGAWQATVHRITKSQTRLKQLSMHACRREKQGSVFTSFFPSVNPLLVSHSDRQALAVLNNRGAWSLPLGFCAGLRTLERTSLLLVSPSA